MCLIVVLRERGPLRFFEMTTSLLQNLVYDLLNQLALLSMQPSTLEVIQRRESMIHQVYEALFQG
jgi:hypothetical protein